MVKVKALQAMHGGQHGEVRVGDVLEVSDPTAREWCQRGLAEEVDAPEEKEAPQPENKMAPPPLNKSRA